MPDRAVDSNAAAVAGERAGGKHACEECNVYPGKHSEAERSILCVVVSRRGARKHSADYMQAIGCEAAADRTEGGGVLSQQGAKRAFG